MKPDRRIAGLYAIADTQYLGDKKLAEAVALAIEGGARVIQYRDKVHTPAQRRHQAESIASICRSRGVPLIINNDVELAAQVAADGVHLGQGDTPLLVARRRLGEDMIIGASCYADIERAARALADGADYVAFGSFFPSRTKPAAARAPIHLLAAAKARLRAAVVAIGGITPENGALLVARGADAVAAAEGIYNRPDIRAAAECYSRLFGGKFKPS